MNDAFYDYENKVERGETVTIAGRSARWTKIKNLKVGARIAIPKDEIMNRFASNRHSGNPPAGGASRIDSGVPFDGVYPERSRGAQGPQNDGYNGVSWDEIVSIKSMGRERVYDIEVEGTHNFIGGHLVNRLTKTVIPSAVEESLAHASDPATRAEILRQAGLAQDAIEYGGVFAHNTYVSGNLGVGSSSPVNKFEVSGKVVIGSSYAQVATAPDDGLLVQGNVGIGTTAPGATLEVNGTLKVDSLTTGGSALYINGGILSSSDESLKDNITGFGSVLDKINALAPVDFNWKKSGMSDTGFVAQNVQQVFPELVGEMGNGTLGVYYSKFTPYLVKGIQEQQLMIDSGQARLDLLEARLARMTETALRMTGIEGNINVGIGSTSPLASRLGSLDTRYSILDAKLAENGQILGQQGAKLNTVDAAIQALQKQVTALQAVILSPANGGGEGSLANASPTSVGDASAALSMTLVTAEGTIPSDLSYGIGIENGVQSNGGTESSASAEASPSASGGQSTDEQSNGVVEGTSSALPVMLIRQLADEASSSSVTASGLDSSTSLTSLGMTEGTASAGLVENGVQSNGGTESSASAEASPSATASSWLYPVRQLADGVAALPRMTESSASATPSALPNNGTMQQWNNVSSDVSLDHLGNLTVTAGLRVFGQTLLGPTNIAGTATVGNLVIDESSLDAFGILRIQTLARGLIELMAGAITIDTSGDIILHSGNLVVETGQIYGNDSMRGSTTLTTGATYAVVPQSWTKAPKSIVVTPDYNTKAWVENLGANGFIVRVAPAPTNSQKVYWIAVW